jgi:hypothetical protein
MLPPGAPPRKWNDDTRKTDLKFILSRYPLLRELHVPPQRRNDNIQDNVLHDQLQCFLLSAGDSAQFADTDGALVTRANSVVDIEEVASKLGIPMITLKAPNNDHLHFGILRAGIRRPNIVAVTLPTPNSTVVASSFDQHDAPATFDDACALYSDNASMFGVVVIFVQTRPINLD